MLPREENILMLFLSSLGHKLSIPHGDRGGFFFDFTTARVGVPPPPQISS